MFSRSKRAMLSVLLALSIVFSIGIGVPNTVFCISSEHTAIEEAQEGSCTSCPNKLLAESQAVVHQDADLDGCGSCWDIPLGSTTDIQVASAQQSGLLKVLVSVITPDDLSHLALNFSRTISLRPENHAYRARSVVSTTVLQI